VLVREERGMVRPELALIQRAVGSFGRIDRLLAQECVVPEFEMHLSSRNIVGYQLWLDLTDKAPQPGQW
jgi:hypothetical protein